MQIVLANANDLPDFDVNPFAEIKGDAVTPERILDLWINTIFHTEPEKKRDLEALVAFAGQLPEFTFVDTINAITNQIGRVRGVIEEAKVEFPQLFKN